MIFIDTNVFMYAVGRPHPLRDPARMFFAEAMRDGTPLCTSAVLGTGYLRGADLWHVATALYVSPDPSELAFVTVDTRQGTAAEALGFVTLEATTSR